MTNESSQADTPQISWLGVPISSKPAARIAVAGISAWASSSCVAVAILFIAFMAILVSGGIEGRPSIAVDQLPLLLFTTVFFTLLYGIWLPLFSLVQILIFGVPAILIGLRFKLIRWWTCIMVGAILSGFPWSLIWILITMAEGGSPYAPELNEILIGVGLILALGLCGGLGGLAFWLVLRRLGFPNIHRANQLPQGVQGNAYSSK